MVKQNRGRIISLTSEVDHGHLVQHVRLLHQQGGDNTLTEGLARELAHTNIRVNALGPGGIPSRMAEEIRDEAAAAGSTTYPSRAGRWPPEKGTPPSRATALALFLACDDSGNMSGKLLSAMLDDVSDLREHVTEIMGSDAYQLRRQALP